MKNEFLRMDNEKGSVMIFAIMMLALLTIIGFASINTSTVESMIAGNDAGAKTAFYTADGGISYALATQLNFCSYQTDWYSFTPANMPADITLDCRKGTSRPNSIEVRSVGTANRGATSTIVAGVIIPSPQGPGNLTNY